MKKLLFILTFAITISLSTISVFAFTIIPDRIVWLRGKSNPSNQYFEWFGVQATSKYSNGDWYITLLQGTGQLYIGAGSSNSFRCSGPGDLNPTTWYNGPYIYDIQYYVSNGPLVNGPSTPEQSYDSLEDWEDSQVPPEPEPGSSWLSDLWDWFLWQLGLNDDYSGDIDAYITGGDRERMEMVTPSPTPSPTPFPSPTPYSLNIVDNNGNPVYTITGIPGNTYNITNNTNNNDGSDFDIFEVDLKIGDGGSTNPRDGLNDVMDSSLTYLSDSENVDMQPVGDSFSIIPNDWFLLLGVVACFPFIAGFISKLLK